MVLAMEREQTAYRSLLMVAGVVLASAEPMLTRLVRGCIALAVTASVPADQSSPRLADPVKDYLVASRHTWGTWSAIL